MQTPLRSPLLQTTHRVVIREGESPAKTTVIYLAHDLAFSEYRKTALLPPIVAALESLGLDVGPSCDPSSQADSSQPGWAYQFGQQSFTDIALADAVLALVHGSPPDEGVMVDLGIAIALGKPTFLLRDDTRRVQGDDTYPLNLKLFIGMPREDWRDYYYTSVEEITAPGKALARWAGQQQRRSSAIDLLPHSEMLPKLSHLGFPPTSADSGIAGSSAMGSPAVA